MSVSVGSREFGKSSQDAGLRSDEFLGQFFSDPAFNLLGNLVICSSVFRGTDVFCDWLFLGCSFVSLNTAANFHLFLIVAIS